MSAKSLSSQSRRQRIPAIAFRKSRRETGTPLFAHGRALYGGAPRLDHAADRSQGEGSAAHFRVPTHSCSAEMHGKPSGGPFGLRLPNALKSGHLPRARRHPHRHALPFSAHEREAVLRSRARADRARSPVGFRYLGGCSLAVSEIWDRRIIQALPVRNRPARLRCSPRMLNGRERRSSTPRPSRPATSTSMPSPGTGSTKIRGVKVADIDG